MLRSCLNSVDLYEGFQEGVLNAWVVGERHRCSTVEKAIQEGFREALQTRGDPGTQTTERRKSKRPHAGSRTMSAYIPGLHHGTSQLERYHVWTHRETTLDEVDGHVSPPTLMLPPLPIGQISTHTRRLTDPGGNDPVQLDTFDMQSFIDSTLHGGPRRDDSESDSTLPRDEEAITDDDDDDEDADTDTDTDAMNENASLDKCAICYSRVPIIIMNPCEHVVCSTCISKLRRRNLPCPFCRSNIDYISEDLTSS